VDQLQKRADGAADAFEGVDGQLADKLTEGATDDHGTIGGDVAGIRRHASRYSSTARAVSERSRCCRR
jgi:hypothetical protein